MAILEATYILYYLCPRPVHLLLIANITSIEFYTLSPRPLIHIFHVHDRHARIPHPVDLGNAQSQPARAPSDHDYFISQVNLAGCPIRDALVEDRQEVEEGKKRGVGGCVDEGWCVVGGCLGAKAQGDHPGDEWVEDGVGENVEEEVES